MFYCALKVLEIHRRESNTNSVKPLRISRSVSTRVRSIKGKPELWSYMYFTVLLCSKYSGRLRFRTFEILDGFIFGGVFRLKLKSSEFFCNYNVFCWVPVVKSSPPLTSSTYSPTETPMMRGRCISIEESGLYSLPG